MTKTARPPISCPQLLFSVSGSASLSSVGVPEARNGDPQLAQNCASGIACTPHFEQNNVVVLDIAASDRRSVRKIDDTVSKAEERVQRVFNHH